MVPEKVVVTISRYNGFQISIESKSGNMWRYFAVGFKGGLDVRYSYATPTDVDDTLREAAASEGEDPVRYASHNRWIGNFRTIIDTRGGV